MTQSQISDITIPFIVPKRNKGHHEVLGRCTVSTSTLLDISDIVQDFVPLIKNTCFPKTPVELASSIMDKRKMEDINLNIQFSYHLDRASASYKDSFFEMGCFYNVKGNNQYITNEMGILIPIRVKDIFVVIGKLSLSVVEPPDIYFEDILDHVQKFTDTKIYPTVSVEDKKQLPYLVDMGLSIVEYVKKLSDSDTIKKIGKTIKLSLEYPDLLDLHNFKYTTTWSAL